MPPFCSFLDWSTLVGKAGPFFDLLFDKEPGHSYVALLGRN